LIKKLIEFFENFFFICVQTLLIWSCDYGKISLRQSHDIILSWYHEWIEHENNGQVPTSNFTSNYFFRPI